MAIAQQGELIREIRGSIGSETYRFHNGTQIIQRKGNPGIHTTPAALASKNNFAYGTGLMFRGNAEMRARIKFCNENSGQIWTNFWNGRLKELAGSGNANLELPNANHSLTMDALTVAEGEDGTIDFSWTNPNPDDTFVEIFHADFDENANWLRTVRQTTAPPTNSLSITAASTVYIIQRITDERNPTSPFGFSYYGKFNVDYNRKPRF